MTTAQPRTDRDVLNEVASALRDAYDNPPPLGTDALALDVRQQKERALLDEARRRGITARQMSSHARVPGLWLIGRLARLADRAAAYDAEIHHLERELAAVRRARALDVWHQRHPSLPDLEKPMTKVALAEAFGVSRPTIDAWLEEARAYLNEHRGAIFEPHPTDAGE